MDQDISEVKNWMHMFRWIVKLIRDEYGIDEKILVRHAALETDIVGLRHLSAGRAPTGSAP